MATTEELPEFAVVEKEAKYLITSGQAEKAKAMYTSLIERLQDSTDHRKFIALARNNRGHLRYLAVDFDGAIEDYTTAIKLDPCLAVAYYNRGQIHYRMGRFELAIIDLEKALVIDPNFTDAQDNLTQARHDLAIKK